MKLCPKCGYLSYFDSYFQKCMCNTCQNTWKEEEKMSKELIWSEDQDFVYGLKSDFASKEEFIEEVTNQYDNGRCIIKNIKIEPCVFTSDDILPGVLIPLSMTDIAIENYYTAEIEEEDTDKTD